MNVKPDVWFDPSHWFKLYNILVLVTLRTDIVYDIKAHTVTGSLKMRVPEDIILNNTILQTTTGEVLLNSFANTKFEGKVSVQSTTGTASVISKRTNYTYGLNAGTTTGTLVLSFENCLLGNDLTGIVTTGSIFYTTNNLTFIQGSTINLQTTTGTIYGTINQYEDLGANVTGNLAVVTGSIELDYVNDKSGIGTRFSGAVTTGNLNYVYSASEFTRFNGVLTSGNYNSAPYKYTFSLSTVTGTINLDAESHH
jgi:hypothetical protein